MRVTVKLRTMQANKHPTSQKQITLCIKQHRIIAEIYQQPFTHIWIF